MAAVCRKRRKINSHNERTRIHVFGITLVVPLLHAIDSRAVDCAPSTRATRSNLVGYRAKMSAEGRGSGSAAGGGPVPVQQQQVVVTSSSGAGSAGTGGFVYVWEPQTGVVLRSFKQNQSGTRSKYLRGAVDVRMLGTC